MFEILSNLDYTPFVISLKLSLIATFVLFCICVPLAFFMARKNFRGKSVIESIISLPLVLPPSVLGFYLLVFLSPYSVLGEFFDKHFGLRLVFNFSGLWIASCIYSLPFMFSPLVSGFRSLPRSLFWACDSLGKGYFSKLFRVALPAIRHSLLCAYDGRVRRRADDRRQRERADQGRLHRDLRSDRDARFRAGSRVFGADAAF